MEKFKAKADITVNGKKFPAGEVITENMSEPDLAFLLREGYIEKVPEKKPAKEASAEKKESTRKKGGA